MLPPRIQSKKTPTTCIFFERGKYCPVCACASAKRQIKSLQCRFQYQPRPPENAHWRSQRFPGCLPASHYQARTQELQHSGYLKGTQGERHEKKILPTQPRYFKQIFPATQLKRQTPCGGWDEDARDLPLRCCGASNPRSYTEMHSPSPMPRITRVCFSPPIPPSPPGPGLYIAHLRPLSPSPPSPPAPRGGSLTSWPQVRCVSRAATGLAPQAQAVPPLTQPSLSRRPAATPTPWRGPRAGGDPPGSPPGDSSPLERLSRHRRRALSRRLATPPRQPGRSPPVPAARRLGGPRYGVPQRGGCRGNARPKEARGRARNGAGQRSALEAPAPRISFSPRTRSALGISRRREADGEVPSSLEFTSESGERLRHLQPTAGLPLSPAGALPSGRSGPDAAVGKPLPRAARQFNGTPGQRAAAPPSPAGTTAPLAPQRAQRR